MPTLDTRALFLVTLVGLPACGAAAMETQVEAPVSAGPSAPPPAPAELEASADTVAVEAMPAPQAMLAATSAAAPTEPPADAPAPPRTRLPEVPSPAPEAGGEAAQSAVIAEARKMIDLEARFSVEVEDIAPAVARLHELTEKAGGQIISENVTSAEGPARAELSLRVPVGGADAFFAALETLGAVRGRNVAVKDIGKQYFDATIRLENLNVTRKRYEEILARATTVEEMLRLEAELGRLRGEVEAVKGELRWLKDRAARATIYVSLFTHADAPKPEIVNPEAKLFPGIRASYLRDLKGDAGSAGYAGATLSIGLLPTLSFEIGGYRDTAFETSGLDALFLTLGGRFYSEFLGDGEREFGNPYLGLRAGYARFLSRNELLGGASVGVEIVKESWFMLDAEARAFAIFGSKAGGHLGVEPMLGASVAF
jgi:hypothetical protein